MTDDIFPEDEVDDLVSQLKDNNTAFNKAQREKVEVNADNLEEFIMKSSGELVQNSLEQLKAAQNSSEQLRTVQNSSEQLRTAKGS